jgi:SAM-dependent methyltransferase
MSNDKILETVREQYAHVAQSALGNDQAAVRNVASAFGYSTEQLSQLPDSANMGLSCGNPLALASLRVGETVVDLGCGGGMDLLLAAKQIGPTGRAIGIDMTPDMLERARRGAESLGLTNVELHQATIESMPLPDRSVDCVISNCVINLVPDKPAVFREILRILKPGGRVAISDIALKQTLPDSVRHSIEAYVGCIAGAILIHDYRSHLEEAGFGDVVVTDTGADLNAYTEIGTGSCCGPTACCGPSSGVHGGLTQLMQTIDANKYAASVRIHAIKPHN